MMPGMRRLLSLALVALAACAPVQASRVHTARPAETGWRHAVSYLVLSPEGPAEGQHIAYFSGRQAARMDVSFIATGRGAIRVQALCDGRARVRPSDEPVTDPAWQAPGQGVLIELGPAERNRTWLELSPETTHCDLQVTPGGRAVYALELLREETARPEIARLDAPSEGCRAGPGAGRLARAMLGQGDLAMTCPVDVGRTRLLPDGLAALNARVEMLTGRAVDPAALEAGDPRLALDWSQAPSFDLIYVNYLNLNADFAGYLVARMLAFHAARGTIVRILVSDIMLTATDRRLFEGLAARYPTVQLQPYHHPAEAAEGFEGELGRLHRVTHVKLFAALSSVPGRSRAMIGGRNIHEGYFFPSPRDLSALPFLHQYNPAQSRLTGGFTAYEDFEIEFQSDDAVRAIVGHMGQLWHRDHDSQRPEPPTVMRQVGALAEGSMVHFISVPFADDQAQIAYFAGLFDAAQSSIRIAIPYLNLPDALEAALRRARERGVRVDIVTTVRVREATDFFVSGLNRDFANEFGDWVNFYDYDPFPRLLHAKLFVIDQHLVVVTSTNLNRRSFVHDLENGVVLLDREVARGVDRVIQGYIDGARRMGPGQPVSRFLRRLLGVYWISNGF